MSALITQKASEIIKMGDALARASLAPGLPRAAADLPRTFIITRMLSGASEADALLAHLLALPSDLAPAVAHCGGPAGPSFKVHDESLKLRLDADDPDLGAKIIDFRLAHGSRHVVATFDPECIRSALQLVEDLALLRVPADLLFVTSRSEATPRFVSRLEASGSRVVRAHKASLRADDDGEVLIYPGISPQLEAAYASGTLALRQIVQSSSLGIQLAFERSLATFAQSLIGHLHG